MQELDDNALLREYADHNSEEAFATLVARHVNKVYSVALRHTGNPHQAEEVAQVVFVILARKSSYLGRRVVLEGWLYQTTRLTALTLIRSEIRRARRDHEAHMQTMLNQNKLDVWRQIAPLLDTAMARLNETDRLALVLRFFYGRSMKEVGAALGGSEGAATLRLHRALEKLRQYFAKQGVTSTTNMIAGAISSHSVQVAPLELAKSVTVAAMAKGATASSSTLNLVKGALKLMAWTKAKTVLIVSIGLLLAVGTATVLVLKVRQIDIENQVIWALNIETLDKEPPVVLIRPAKRIHGLDPANDSGAIDNGSKMLGLRQSLADIVQMAYKSNYYTEIWKTDRVIADSRLPKGGFDFVAAAPQLNQEALQSLLKEKFGLLARWEAREVDVLVLNLNHSPAPGLKMVSKRQYSSGLTRDGFTIRGDTLEVLAGYLEHELKIPVIDKTGLTNVYDVDLNWKGKARDWSWPSRSVIDQILPDQLGLELAPSREPVEMLIIDKMK